MGHSARVKSVAFSPGISCCDHLSHKVTILNANVTISYHIIDGLLIISGDADGNVILWNRIHLAAVCKCHVS
jgi:hypothetical protein